MKTVNSTKFDRHEVFSQEDLSYFHHLIGLVADEEQSFSNLTNNLYALFDGVFYHDFVDSAIKAHNAGMSTYTHQKLLRFSHKLQARIN